MKKLLLLMLLAVASPVKADEPAQLYGITTKVCKNIKSTSLVFVAAKELGKAFAEEVNRITSPHNRDIWRNFKLVDASTGRPIFKGVEILGEMGVEVNRCAAASFHETLDAQAIDPEFRFFMTYDLGEDALGIVENSPGVITAMKKLGNAVAQEYNSACSVEECRQFKEFIMQEDYKAKFSRIKYRYFGSSIEIIMARALIPAFDECIAHLK